MDAWTFFLGLLSGVLTTTFGSLVHDWWYRPRLRLLLDEPEKGGNWSGHSVRITNHGRTAAGHCQVMITMDAEERDLVAPADRLTLEKLGLPARKFNVDGHEEFLLGPGNFRRIRFELLAWSQIGNPVQVDLYPQTVQMIDVFRLMKSDVFLESQIHVASERGWACIRGAFALRPYTIELKAVAANARQEIRTYVVEIDEAGKDVRLVPAATRRSLFERLTGWMPQLRPAEEPR